MSTAATQLANLSATQRELLANLLKAKRLSETEAIPKQPRDKGLPLSFAQQRMWFLAQLEPENPNYNIAGAIEIIGELNVPLLEKSINEVMRRHEVLRSIFKAEGQETEQWVLNERHVSLSRLDFSHLSPEDYQLTQNALLAEELSKPFELLAGGDLLRVSLLSPAPFKHCLLLTMHHIVSDEWSLRLLIKEIGQIYTAFAQGREPYLPELPIQYADYATWQRSKFSGEQRDKLLNYWTNLLDDVPALLDLPCDYSRPPKPSYRGGSHSMVLPKSLADEVTQFSKAHGMTPFMTLIGAFAMLMHRYTTSDDVCIGYPTTNRHKPELEGLIGFFVNTLVFRSRLGGDVDLGAYFARVRQHLLDGQKYKDLPFEQLVEALNPQRDMRYHPVFQVMFSYQERAFDLPDMPGLTFCLPAVESVSAKFDLVLQVGQSAAGFDCQFEYSSDLFAPSSIARLAEHFKILLTQVVEKPNSRVSQLQLLLGDEWRKIVYDWNSTPGHYPKDWCLQDLFEAQVEKTPHAIALSVADSSLSYAELNAKANQLAHYLIECGARLDSPVGICLERSPEMVIALLGVLKAGAAYLPLDPHYPKERLRYMLEDAGVGLVLTRQEEASLLDEGRRQVIYLDQVWAEIVHALADKPHLRRHPLNLAYLIYTSGSTGQPKGVAVTHGNAVHSTWARFQVYPDPVEAYLLLSSFAFDSSVAGIFWTLGQGGCLCLPDSDTGKDPAALAILIERHRVSHLLALPSLYGLLLDQPSESLSCLKVAIVAGETCVTEVVKRHFNVLPGVKLYNEYGPTEATVWSSVYQAGPEDLCRTLAIGRPIANVRLYILDPYLNPVPVGVAGELYIGGAGIVRGYLDRPGLSAERFIPDIFQANGARLYQTGDLARYRDDGAIEFLGRLDQQVKIRGFRIELGEIEAQLLKQPGVREAVVLAREDKPGDKRLVAYWVDDSLGSLSCEALIAELKQTLPDYMLPSAFVLLDKLPLGANGKLDRKRLPVPDMSKQLGKQYLAPRNETEATLAGIWKEVLGLERVGVKDDFFELGGHSLLATQLFFLSQKRLATTVTFKEFLTVPTIAAQARLLADGLSIDLEAEAMLEPSIVPLTGDIIDVSAAQVVLLTGATGFLGVFILADLLALTKAKVYCLVRAENEQEAQFRLQRQVDQYELSDRVDFSRIVAVCGDLALPRLGLSDSRHQEIAEHAEVIYHNGALVNFVQPYQALKATNVSGTEEVLRLACCGRAKAIHYVSTVSVFSESPRQISGHRETDDPEQRGNLPNGYAQSKWVAEKLVMAAKARGFQVSIYRPAIVAGDSRNGAWNTSDFWCRLIKGCIQIGYAPCERFRVDMAPVDYMSRSIVMLSLQANAVGGVFHLNHPQPPYSDQWLDCFANLGYPVRRVSYQDWLERVLAFGKVYPEEFALASLLPSFAEQLRDGDTQLSEDEIMQYDCRVTHQSLLALGVECIPVDEAILSRYQLYWVRSGFIPFPGNG